MPVKLFATAGLRDEGVDDGVFRIGVIVIVR